jgi:hypothetical protein
MRKGQPINPDNAMDIQALRSVGQKVRRGWIGLSEKQDSLRRHGWG